MTKAAGRKRAAPRGGAAGSAAGRSNLYGFLAEVYRREPGPALIRRLRSARLSKALATAGAALDADVLDRPERALVDDLAVEYTRLFVGPGRHVPPYASVHMEGEEGLLWGPSTAWAKRFIEATGFEYHPEYRDLPDHISVELEFMQQLTDREAGALEDGDAEQLEAARGLQRQFLAEHLARWVPGFCDKVIAEAELSFYRELAKLTKDFVGSELDAVAAPEGSERS